MKWRDMNGAELFIGDIIENRTKREIGQIIVDSKGHIVMKRWKRWSNETLDYEPLLTFGPDEAYNREFIPRKSRLWWTWNGHCIPDIEMIKHMDPPRRRKRRTDIMNTDAPIPGI